MEQATISSIKNDEGDIINFLSIREDVTALKKTKQELLISNEKLKEAGKIAQLGHWELDHISNKLIWSDETFRIFSLNPKEFEPFRETFYKKIHPEDRDKVREAFLNSLETKKKYKIEHRILLKSGEVKYALQKGVTHYDDTGKPIRSIGTIQDITESKKVEQKLIKSKEKAEESDSLKTEFLNNMSQ